MELREKNHHGVQPHVLRLVLRALGERPAQLIPMLRNFILFFLSSLIVRLRSLGKAQLVLGQNVRIQRPGSLRLIGNKSSIELGSHAIVYENALLEAVENGAITVGECSILGDCRISARACVHIGQRVLLSWNVFIQDYDSHPLESSLRAEQVKKICRRFYPRFGNDSPEINESLLNGWSPSARAIVIEDDVWIGAGVMVLKGAQIGRGSIVAAGSVVVAGVYPEGSVLAGNPARVMKSRNESEVLA